MNVYSHKPANPVALALMLENEFFALLAVVELAEGWGAVETGVQDIRFAADRIRCGQPIDHRGSLPSGCDRLRGNWANILGRLEELGWITIQHQGKGTKNLYILRGAQP